MNSEDAKSQSPSYKREIASSTRGHIWFAMGIIVAFLGVFVIPWYVPLHDPTKGESYSLGFSNRTAVIALGISFVLVFIGHLRTGYKCTGLSWFSIPQSSPSHTLFPSIRKGHLQYLILIFAILICAIAILSWNAYLVVPYWGESSNFLSRIDLARLGYKPYIDFQFDYGPALIYAPIGLDWISGGVLGIENAYAGCIALSFALGFMGLFIIQRFLNVPESDRPWILASIIGIWFTLSMGLQYTPLRYSVVPCSLLIGNLLILRNLDRRFSNVATLFIVSVGCSACYMISPEMGIACTVGFAASASVYGWTRKISTCIACVAGILISLFLIGTFSQAYLQSVLSFASGAQNFPVYPNLINVTFVACSLYVLPRLAFSIWQKPSNLNAPIAAGIGAASTTLIPVALGRCDPGHIIINGLMIFILLFPCLVQTVRFLYKTWGVFFVVLFIVLFQFSYWDHYWPLWKQAFADHNFYAQNPDAIKKWSLAWTAAGAQSKNFHLLNWHKVVRFPEIGEDLMNSHVKIAAPLNDDAELDRYLKIQNTYIPEYYPTIYQLYTPRDVDRIVRDTQTRYEYLLIREDIFSYLREPISYPDYEKRIQGFLTGLMLYPVHTTFRNKPYIPEAEVAQSLLTRSSIVRKKGNYLLLKLSP